MKKGIVVGISALVLIAIGVAVFFYLSSKTKDYLPAEFAIPSSAVVILKSYEPADTTVEQTFEEKLLETIMPKVQGQYQHYMSLFGKVIENNLEEQPFLVSLHASASNRLEALFLYQTNGYMKERRVDELFLELFPKARIFTHTFNATTIYEVKDEQKELLLAFALKDGILALAQSTALIEDAVAAYSRNLETSEPLLTEILNSNEGRRVFVNFRQLPTLFEAFAQSGFKEDIREVGQFATYAALEMTADENALISSGLIEAREEDEWRQFYNQSPKQLGLYAVLPYNTLYFTAWGADDFGTYRDAKLTDSYKGETKAWQERYAIDFAGEVLNWINDEWGTATLESAEAESGRGRIVVIKTKEASQPLESMETINRKVASISLVTPESEEHRNFKVEQLLLANFLEVLFGEQMKEFTSPYYTQLGEYMIFASSADEVKKLIDAFVDNQTLNRKVEFKQLSKHFASESNLLFYVNTDRIANLQAKFLNDKVSFIPLIRTVGGVAFQLTSNQNSLFGQLVIGKQQDRKGEAARIWELTLESDIWSRPLIVNQPETEQKEILVQDASNNLYLISNTGAIKWKKPIDGPVVGEVYQIDLYKSGELQYLFATPSMVYLLDHDGMAVGNYPLRLSALTHTGVFLTDTDDSRDYKYYIGTDNNKIYGFNAGGKPLAGWSPQNINSTLSMPLKYFTTKGTTYILGVTELGTFYLWRENGTQVFKPVELNTSFNNPFTVRFGPTYATTYIFSVDTANVLTRINLEGGVSRYKYDAGTSPAFFEYIDADDKEGKEIVLFSGKNVSIYTRDSVKQSSFTTASPVEFAPSIVPLKDKTLVALPSPVEHQIYLYDLTGRLYSGFPIKGNVPASVGDLNGDGILEMVTGDGRQLILYNLGTN